MAKLSLRNLLEHPVTFVMAAVGIGGSVLKLPIVTALWATLWAKASAIFTVLSIAGFTLGPRVAFIPEEPLTVAALGAGALVALKTASKVYDNYEDRLS